VCSLDLRRNLNKRWFSAMAAKEEIDKLNDVNIVAGEKRKLMRVRKRKGICVRMY
jgi:hypothetical protein